MCICKIMRLNIILLKDMRIFNNKPDNSLTLVIYISLKVFLMKGKCTQYTKLKCLAFAFWYRKTQKKGFWYRKGFYKRLVAYMW